MNSTKISCTNLLAPAYLLSQGMSRFHMHIAHMVTEASMRAKSWLNSESKPPFLADTPFEELMSISVRFIVPRATEGGREDYTEKAA
jgi:hypothetical protein